MFGFGKKKETGYREVALPGDIGTVSLPDPLIDELENDDTLMAFVQNDNTLYLRFSSLTIVPKDPDNVSTGYDFVRDTALEKGIRYTIHEDKYIVTYDEQDHKDASHLMRYWQAGSGNLVFFASASLKPFQRLSRRARVILDLMPQIIQSIKINKAMEIIETDGKQIPVMTETVDPIAGKQKPFSAVENNWLQTNLNKAGVLGIKYSSGGELTPKELDIIFSRWMSSSESKESNEDIANALGAAFGQYFVEKHGFKWMVHFWNGEPESMVLRDNVMTYPLSVVWKRIDSGDINFFDDISSVILQRQEENRNN